MRRIVSVRWLFLKRHDHFHVKWIAKTIAQFFQRLCFNLTNTLSSEPKLLTNLFERVGLGVFQADDDSLDSKPSIYCLLPDPVSL